MNKTQKHYFGRAGHLFVMSELLLKQWNVAIPEVDTGDDVFVVQDNTEGAFAQVARVQVKAANAVLHQKTDKKLIKAQFFLRLDQLRRITITPKLVYIFAARFENTWLGLCIIEQSQLRDIYKQQPLQAQGNAINLTLYYDKEMPSQVSCYGLDFSNYINNFNAIFPS